MQERARCARPPRPHPEEGEVGWVIAVGRSHRSKSASKSAVRRTRRGCARVSRTASPLTGARGGKGNKWEAWYCTAVARSSRSNKEREAAHLGSAMRARTEERNPAWARIPPIASSVAQGGRTCCCGALERIPVFVVTGRHGSNEHRQRGRYAARCGVTSAGAQTILATLRARLFL